MRTFEKPVVNIKASRLRKGVVICQCPHCSQEKPIDAFGLRRMKKKDGTVEVRAQSWCRECRSNQLRRRRSR